MASHAYAISVITQDEEMFREVRRVMSAAFRISMVSSEAKIKELIDDSSIHGLILDLDVIGDCAEDGVEVLAEMHRLRQDMVMVAVTGSKNIELPLHASQAGADHLLRKPLDCRGLRDLLLQTLEKRALQFEGQWLLQQVESQSAFCRLIGGSDAMR